MGKRLNFYYDKKGDILDISVGKPQKAISEEIQDDFFIRKNPKTKEVVGFMILNFEKRFGKSSKPTEIPLSVNFTF